jgi:hypothetical protein
MFQSTYKVRTVVLLSFLITFFLTEQYLTFHSLGTFSQNLLIYFTQDSTISFYGEIIGLLLAAYVVMVTLMPNFSYESLQMPIFHQINSLFLFTMLDGIMMMILGFAQGILNFPQILVFWNIPFYNDLEIFFFLALMIGLVFCILTLSQLFHLMRTRGEDKRHSRPK